MKNWIIFLGIIIVATLGVVGVAYVSKQEASSHGEEVEHDTEEKPSAYTIEEIPVEDAILHIPDLSRSIQFSADIPANIQILTAQKVEKVVGRLKDNATRGDDWLELGILFYSAGDLEGARLVWEFLAEIDPTNTVSYDNLAKMYHFSLKDFPKSESYFKQSMAIDPLSLTPYLGLHELYRYSYKVETTLAADILKTAIKQFPDTFGLYLTLGNYYRDTGKKDLSRATLLEGMDKAREAGDVDLMAAFGSELERVQ